MDKVIQVVAMPCDTNPDGDIFGGWLLSQMDLAGGILAKQKAKSRVVTITVDKMTFLKPVNVGDILVCYADVEAVGNTSITISVVACAIRAQNGIEERVTEGLFKYVAIDENRKPKKIVVEADPRIMEAFNNL
jgi:acyl-CoA thioesterase YciA